MRCSHCGEDLQGKLQVHGKFWGILCGPCFIKAMDHLRTHWENLETIYYEIRSALKEVNNAHSPKRNQVEDTAGP